MSATYDVVSCIGATWIGDGLAGTLELLSRAVRPGGWVLVGEVFWTAPPEPGYRASKESGQRFEDLSGTLDIIEAAGFDLLEMVLANEDDWVRYEASQWLAAADWVRSNPDDPRAPLLAAEVAEHRRGFLAHRRDCMGWGVFVLRAPG